MFDTLSDKLETVFKKLRGAGTLSEKNIRDSMREVRQALLEADVNYKVAREFVKAVEEKAVGTEVLKSIEPGQMVIKVVHDELVTLLGSTAVPLAPLDKMPTIFMVCGLQGSGKTTLVGKLVLWRIGHIDPVHYACAPGLPLVATPGRIERRRSRPPR